MSDTLIAYERIAKGYRRKAWKLLVDFATEDLEEGEVIADLGCGTGDLCRKIIESSTKKICLGIDFSPNMLREALRKSKELGYDFLNPLVAADVTHLPLRDSAVDKVVIASTLHHLISRQERIRALKEIHRVLKEGKEVLITVWSRWQSGILKEVVKGFIYYLLGRKESFWDTELCSRTGCRNYHFYSLKELIKDVSNAGLVIKEHGVYEPLKARGVPSKNYFIKALKTKR